MVLRFRSTFSFLPKSLPDPLLQRFLENFGKVKPPLQGLLVQSGGDGQSFLDGFFKMIPGICVHIHGDHGDKIVRDRQVPVDVL